jgi:DNA-binding transcriptional regulator GbsR (MarR family)
MTTDNKRELRDMIDEVLKRKIDANRRFVDEVLEKIQDENHEYFLEKLGNELQEIEINQKAGNLQGPIHHQVMADVYKSILERCFF